LEPERVEVERFTTREGGTALRLPIWDDPGITYKQGSNNPRWGSVTYELTWDGHFRVTRTKEGQSFAVRLNEDQTAAIHDLATSSEALAMFRSRRGSCRLQPEHYSTLLLRTDTGELSFTCAGCEGRVDEELIERLRSYEQTYGPIRRD
jgi:hypothetical protein